MTYLKYLIPVLIIGTLSSCASVKPYYNKEHKEWKQVQMPDTGLKHTVYLIGDAGKATNEMPQIKAIKKQIGNSDTNTTLVFLGDNIYPAGLPEKDAEDRKASEKYLKAQLEVTKINKGNSYFVAGNHDWNYMRAGGFKAIKRQQDFIEDYNKQAFFEPKPGCAGPKVVKLSDGLVLVLIDSQWWFHDLAKDDKIDTKCKTDSKTEFIERLNDVFAEHEDDIVIFANHHPFKTNGPHGGFYTPSDHLFPFRALNKSLWIPLPGLGSIYPVYRKVFGSKQDVNHPLYQSYINEIERQIKEDNAPVIIASGHEHNLQFFHEGNINYVVSGSGSKLNYVKRGGDASFAHQSKGYSRVLYYNDGAVFVEYYSGDENGNPQLNFRYPIENSKMAEGKKPNGPMNETYTVSINDRYEASAFKRAFLGRQYRTMYNTKITVPSLNLDTKFGGLNILKLGGGQSTNSLRVATSEGKEYVVRSIDKNFSGLIPDEFRHTLVEDLFKDQVSANFPYGATTVPTMAKALGVYHTNPKYVYMPKQNKLGDYGKKVGGAMYLFEERPDDEHNDLPSFGEPDKIVGTTKLIENLNKNNENKVDAEAFLKARLFDIILGDWDRHGDQWRWSGFKNDGNEVYKPIPRDRDQVYYRFVGLLPYFASRKWAVRNFQNFRGKIRDLKGLTLSGVYIDNYVLNELDWDSYKKSAAFVQSKLTDEIITQAITEGLPPEVYNQEGPYLIETLIERRNDLLKYARQYYKLNTDVVDVIGSNEKEIFDIVRLKNGNVEVKVYDWNDGQRDELLYTRTILKKETKEIRIYGLKNDDVFNITGKGKKGPLVRIVGGLGNDEYNDDSKVAGLRKANIIYDMPDDNDIKVKKESKIVLSRDPEVNEYYRKLYKPDTYFPSIALGYNQDYGFYFGGGITWTNYNWRLKPFSNKHNVKFRVSPETGSFELNHKSEWRNVFGKNGGFTIDNQVSAPFVAYSFYGIGNNTDKTADEDFYQYNLNLIKSYPAFLLGDKDNINKLTIGPQFKFYKPEQENNGFVNEQNNQINTNDFKENYRLGPKFVYTINKVNSEANPTDGVRIKLKASHLFNVNNFNQGVSSLNAEVTYYFNMKLFKRTTIATRAGVGTTFGDRKFYENQYLGSRDNFRGLLHERFAGKNAFYHNNDLRLNLFKVNGKLPFDVGLVGSYDYGLVWGNGVNESRKLQQSYGGGLWIGFFDIVILNGNFMKSTDDELVSFGLGFFF